MDNVYEVMKKEEPREGVKGMNMPRESGRGLFQFERSAIKFAKQQNDSTIVHLIKEATTMTGTVRGPNRDRYQQIVQKILNPPYSVKPRRLNRR
tara:strand:+ start:291 stop:572 length:282 start_codon:yes stop_codon:yes gene_type:complete